MEIKSGFDSNYYDYIFKNKIVKNNSKGIDKKSFKSYSTKEERDKLYSAINKKVQDKEYKFSPYLELLRVKKRNTSPRMISIPTIRDKIVLITLKSILHDVFPENINKEQPNSYIKKIKNYIEANSNNELYFIKVDISQFYDNIKWDKLKKKLSQRITNKYHLKLIMDGIKTPTVPANYHKEDLHRYILKKGVPQGLPISNILAQIYIQDLDTYCIKTFQSNSLYLRYVDDILILTNNELTNHIEIIESKLKELGLKLNRDKTSQGKLSGEFDFLGYLISNNKVTIGKRTIENQINKIAGKITWFKKGIENESNRPYKYKDDPKGFARQFIKEVNQIITGSKSSKKSYGWLFYYLEIDDLSVLYKMDKVISSLIKDIPYFQNKVPKNLKKTSRAFAEIKYNNGGNYINDFDKIKTQSQMKKYLSEAAALDEKKEYTNEEIELAFINHREKLLKHLNENIVY